MDPLHLDGARSPGAGNVGSSTSGSLPLPSVEAIATSRRAADAFVAQIEMSMLQSLAQLGGTGGDDAGGDEESGGEDFGIDVGGGIDQTQLMATLFTGLRARGASAASIQAQLSAIGGLGGGSTAGAGDEARLAQSLVSGHPASRV